MLKDHSGNHRKFFSCRLSDVVSKTWHKSLRCEGHSDLLRVILDALCHAASPLGTCFASYKGTLTSAV